jgi:hypothetical protein
MRTPDKNLSVLASRSRGSTEVEGRTVDELAEEAVCRLLLRKGSAPPQGRLQSWTS